MEMVWHFFLNGGLLTYSSVSQIFEFGFRTRIRSLPDALRHATPKKRLPGAGGGFLTSTVHLTSIDHPPIGGKFTTTPGGLTNLFYGCKD